MAELNEPLSDRELDVLALLVQGASNKEIASSLFISPNTVKVHLRNIYTKLGVSTRTEATIAAVEQQIVSLGGEIQVAEEAEKVESVVALSDPPPPAVGGDPAIDLAAPMTPGLATTGDSPQLSIKPEGGAAAHPTPAAGHRTRWLWPAVTLLALLAALISFVAPQLTENFSPEPTPAAATPPDDVQIENTRWFITQDGFDPVWGGVLISAGVDLFQIGGGNAAGGVTDTVAVFDSTTKTWREGPPKPTPVREAAGANLGGILYIVGGLGDGDQPLNLVEAFSPADNVWRPVADLPRPLYGGAVVSDGSVLYYLGGHDGVEAVTDVYVYNPGSDRWSVLPSLPEPRAFAAAGSLENNLVVVGGENNGDRFNSCYLFDLLAQTWDTCASLSRPRSRAGAAVVLNKLYVLGGATDAHFGELFDPNLDNWEIINVPMLAAGDQTDWISPGVSNIEAKIYLIGGRRADGQINDRPYVYAPLVYRAFFPATQDGGAPDQ